ncbi:MAG: hypothetical protein HZA51_17700 [Planctomycetes bacterium]|nr:hypothetical protein [Planctomycetota bacterium]
MATRNSTVELSRSDLEVLRSLRTDYSRSGTARKKRVLRQLMRRGLGDAVLIREYHEALLFLAAYPDDQEVWGLSQKGHRRIAAEVRRLTRASKTADRRLENSGIAGSRVTCHYSLDLLAWMVERFPRELEFDWEDGSLGDDFEEVLPMLASRVEGDGLMADHLTTREWVRKARGRFRGSDLAWIVSRFQRTGVKGPLLDRVFDSLELPVVWRVGAKASRTLGRLPGARAFCHVDGIRKLGAIQEEVMRPVPGEDRVSAAEAKRLMEVVRTALAVRQRETDAATYTQMAEVRRWRLERGFEVVMYGMSPERRLPIESFYGFLLAKNGIPLGYGGGWVFFDRCEIGVNIFDSFRGGESAYGFAQVMRVYRQVFKSRRFTVDPYQFGEGNPEAIKSGAFWFYYRLGFRPLEAKLAKLAADEWAKIGANRAYRSSATVLRRLARAHIAIDLEEGVTDTPDLKRISLAATTWIGQRFAGDREAAEAWAVRRVERMAGMRMGSAQGVRSLAVLVAMVDGIERWTNKERRKVGEVVRAKGGVREAEYSAKLLRCGRLREAWG